jgi:hypothetical protein
MYVKYVGVSVFFEGLALALTLFFTRQYFETSMFSHMLVQFPLLLISGYRIFCNVSGVFPRVGKQWNRFTQLLISFDSFGISGLLLLLLVSAFWMVPRMLEESLTNMNIEFLKFISLLVLGSVVPSSLNRANWVIQLFFLGNFCGMTAIVGLIYQETPQRLCNSYLIDDQKYTGVGLVCISIGVPLIWCLHNRRYFIDKNTH